MNEEESDMISNKTLTITEMNIDKFFKNTPCQMRYLLENNVKGIFYLIVLKFTLHEDQVYLKYIKQFEMT